MHCASGSAFARHVTKLAVLCHCVEEDPNKSLFQGQPVVPAHGIGAAGAHCRENKDTEHSLPCLQCGKGASEGTSCFWQVFQISCNPVKAKPPHRGGVSAVFPQCCCPSSLLVPVFLLPQLPGENLAAVHFGQGSLGSATDHVVHSGNS